MLRVILPSLQRIIKQNYTAAITFFFLLSSFYLVLLHQIFAEWIAIKRPNSSHVNFTRNNYFTFGWIF
jgi:hypothetical protein